MKSQTESMMIFFFIALTIMGLAYGYVGWRMIAPWRLSGAVTTALWLMPGMLLLMPFATIFMRLYSFHPFWKTAFAWIAYLGMGLFSILFVLILTRDILLLTSSGSFALIGVIRNACASGTAAAVCRFPDVLLLTRQSNVAILLLTAVLMGYGIYGARRIPQVKEVAIPIENLPESLGGLKIVQITDIHAGTTIGRGYVQNIVDRVNALSPGAIRTPMNVAKLTSPEVYEDQLLRLIPYKRIGEPEDVARAAVWLASDESDYVNGTTIYIDGGMTLYPGFIGGG